MTGLLPISRAMKSLAQASGRTRQRSLLFHKHVQADRQRSISQQDKAAKAVHAFCSDAASLLQSFCKLVAELLHTGLQNRCNFFAVTLQQVYSNFARGVQRFCNRPVTAMPPACGNIASRGHHSAL